ncbi:outer membrane protein assembly factor BamB family protein [Lignipirellula cremea]|uniref:Outer membrane biogenesis protein BamB n=1 Tax=Lignipirellula cremea TaxID=2528010 RepID=A0A518DXC2_9BACT|nr:PQQ-binding-like beta-propeller repeat protein [Lignipirellula cremea]QDU96482.1 outer membrane biogenesis protein BamB [Lignipirellula cremea]
MAGRYGLLILTLLGGALLEQQAPAQMPPGLPFLLPLGQRTDAPVDLSPADLDFAKKSELELLRAARVLGNEQWETAIETLRNQMEAEGSQLIARDDSVHRPLDKEYELFVPVRELCQRRLAELHTAAPEALRLYRSQVDSLAQRWLKEGLAQRDERLLRRVREQFFISSYGDDAAFWLGEFHLQRGEHTSARACWESISPQLRSPPADDQAVRTAFGDPLWRTLRTVDWKKHGDALLSAVKAPSPAPCWTAYPDTDIPLADVRARLALVSILEGSPDRAALEIDLLNRLHPDAAGRLAGEEGPYAATLQKLLAESREWPTIPAPKVWPTLGGSQTRTAIAAGQVDPGGTPLWSFPLPRESAGSDRLGIGRSRPGESHDGLLSYHPIVVDLPEVGQVVLVPEMTRLFALKLQTGEPAWNAEVDGWPAPFYSTAQAQNQDLSREQAFPDRGRFPYAGAPRFTLNALGDKLIARMGSPLTGIRRDSKGAIDQGEICVFNLAARGQVIKTLPPEEANWSFDGVPVTDGSNLYVVLRHTVREDPKTTLHVAAFDLKTGQRRWRRWVCTAASPGGSHADELTHTLLTLAEGNLYCNTHLGVVAALSASDGALQWATRYRRTSPGANPEENDQHFFRDLAPCVFHKGIVIAAPADCDHLFALDASTGLVLWDTAAHLQSDAVHLLGVSGDTLLASGDNLYWISTLTGQLTAAFPGIARGPGQVGADPPGYGRGVLVDDEIYWPTREQIFVFAQQPHHGAPVLRRRIDLSANLGRAGGEPLNTHSQQGGNLLVVDGVLLIAGPDRLTAYNDTGRPRTYQAPADDQ